MPADIDRDVADLKGAAALPRKNGELVFNQPWEGRIFGMALALRSQTPYAWSDFRERLERQIAAAGPSDDGSRYYEHWLGAFEALLNDMELLTPAELERRAHEYEIGLREEVF